MNQIKRIIYKIILLIYTNISVLKIKLKAMNWKLILFLCLPGIAMGFASVYGFTVGIEWLLWLTLFIIYAIVIAKTETSKYFLHGLLIGIITAVISTLIQFLFFDIYVLNNPLSDADNNQIPGNLEPRVFFLLSAPLIGIVSGMVIGLFALLASKFIKPKEAAV